MFISLREDLHLNEQLLIPVVALSPLQPDTMSSAKSQGEGLLFRHVQKQWHDPPALLRHAKVTSPGQHV